MKKLLCTALLLAAAGHAHDRAVNLAVYDVVKRDQAPVIDGKTDEAVWQEIPSMISTFHFPWENREAPPTQFGAIHDGENLYFAFVATDADIVKSEAWEGESTVDGEDRVELFFAQGNIDRPGEKGMLPYYAIEIDALGRVHDYAITYYRHFDSAFTLQGLETKAVINEKGYTVEGRIPLAALRELGVLKDNILRTGAYRAEFSSQKDSKEPHMAWLSWIHPDTAHPDFHVDASFGEFRLLP